MLYSILILSLVAYLTQCQLRHVHLMYRHGDRGPVKLYEMNHNREDKWPNGIGQLTDMGIKQQFKLGKWLRLRYKHLLREAYNHTEIRIESTDVDRTIMSAQSNLAGLYHNNNANIIPGLRWRPIPVHIVPRTAEVLMLPFNCNLYLKKLGEIFRVSYDKHFGEFQPIIDHLKNIFHSHELTINNFFYLFDTIICEKSNGLTLDPWVTEPVYGNLSRIYGTFYKMMHNGDELARLSGGLSLSTIIDQMKLFIENVDGRSEKMRVFSGHDMDIAALMAALGVYDGVQPPYNACLMIELWEIPTTEKGDNWAVRVYYKTKETDSPTKLKEMKLSGCSSEPCTLRDFIESVAPRTISLDQYKTLCATTS